MARGRTVANAATARAVNRLISGMGTPVMRAGSGMTGSMQAGSVKSGAACMWQIEPGAIVIEQ